MKTLKVTWTGIRPLIMSNPQTVDVANPYSVESRRLGAELKAARKKADEDRLMKLANDQKRLDFQASAYFDATEKRFYIPDSLIIACIKGGAQTLKKGKDIDRAVMTQEENIYVEKIPAVKSLESAQDNEAFVLETPAKIPPRTGALFIKRRCVMPTGWQLTFHLDFDDNIILEKTLISAMENAGLLVGIGGWRPKFGRFTVEAA